jgi:hypothetical protein
MDKWLSLYAKAHFFLPSTIEIRKTPIRIQKTKEPANERQRNNMGTNEMSNRVTNSSPLVRAKRHSPVEPGPVAIPSTCTVAGVSSVHANTRLPLSDISASCMVPAAQLSQNLQIFNEEPNVTTLASYFYYLSCTFFIQPTSALCRIHTIIIIIIIISSLLGSHLGEIQLQTICLLLLFALSGSYLIRTPQSP